MKMKISRGGLLLFLSHLPIKLVSLAIAQPDLLYFDCTTNIRSPTNNTLYQKNVGTLLSSLSSKPHKYGFYNSSVGESSHTVNALALCRPDVEPDTCRSCVSDSATKLVQACPNAKEAIGGYDNCMVRYSNKSIHGVMSTVPDFLVLTINNVSRVDQFNQAVKTLLDTLRSQAAAGGPLEKFAAGNKTGPEEKQTIYGLVQCTPDLSEQQCNECLAGATNLLPNCCSGRIGGRVITPSCNFRYELNHFFNETLADAPLASPPPTASSPTPPQSSPPPTASSPTSPASSPETSPPPTASSPTSPLTSPPQTASSPTSPQTSPPPTASSPTPPPTASSPTSPLTSPPQTASSPQTSPPPTPSSPTPSSPIPLPTASSPTSPPTSPPPPPPASSPTSPPTASPPPPTATSSPPASAPPPASLAFSPDDHYKGLFFLLVLSFFIM